MKSNNKSIASAALQVLLPIKPAEFIANKYTNGKNKCCAIGHINRIRSSNPNDYSTKNCGKEGHKRFTQRLKDASYTYLRSVGKTNKLYYDTIVNINDSEIVIGYKQKTIKSRVIKLLRDMINAGY